MAEQESQSQRETKERFAGIFGRAAPAYDQAGPHFFARFGDRLTDLAGIRPGETVLDVACGRGASLFPAARRVGPQGHVTGIDLAERMVAELTADLRRRGVHNAEVRLMDAEELAFPAGTFDHVLAGFCLYFFPRLDLALAEIRRVLRPGGLLSVSTWGVTPPEWRWFDDLLAAYGDAADSPETGDSTTTADGGDPFSDADALRELLRRARFTDVRVVSEAETVAYAGEDEWWAGLWSTWARADLEQIEQESGAPGLARFRADVYRHLRAAATPDGILELTPVLYTRADRPPRERTDPHARDGR